MNSNFTYRHTYIHIQVDLYCALHVLVKCAAVLKQNTRAACRESCNSALLATKVVCLSHHALLIKVLSLCLKEKPFMPSTAYIHTLAQKFFRPVSFNGLVVG